MSTGGDETMAMIYLLFVLSVFSIRLFAGYDSRFQRGKYVLLKNPVLSAILLDSMSFYTRTSRLKKDKNKMWVVGIWYYAAAATVLLINLGLLVVPDIPITPWVIESTKFLVYANTLNEKISAIAVLLLFLSLMGCFAVSMIQTIQVTEPKWLKVFLWVVVILAMAVTAAVSIYLLFELISCFL